MTEKIVVEKLYKIFGRSPGRALQMLRQGKNKDEIYAETGMTVGVQDASFTVEEGEIFVVMGLSGSGKSTLVRMLNRLIEPTSGEIRIDGRDITKMGRRELTELRRREVSMVFQSFALMPHLTVLQNAAYGLRIAGVPRREREKRALATLASVGLEEYAASYPDALSGGMQQRVGLARALATDPSVLLMDEAFSALDPLIRTEMQDELMRLQREHARTVVFISHDLDEAIRIGDRIAIMEGGRIAQVGAPEEILRNPADEYVRSFFRGVDVREVYTAKDVAEPTDVTVINRPGTSLRTAIQLIRDRDRDHAVVVDRDRHYQCMVTLDALVAAVRAGRTGSCTEFGAPDVEPLPGDASVAEAVDRVAHSSLPVPVVDERGCYRGVISKTVLLRALSSGDPAGQMQAPDEGKPETLEPSSAA